ncbi:ankyrin-3-like [Microplitis mediator]|uniref:ankyrin-3-like n=1 Tax=Microplitis mediator TaxID=375433 RepID=UPI00255369C3|nr:ankyrin-3-like [Microplitis mediator]XP_057319243.1 ankyrin-3-like [Microplitis mediator]
MIRRQSASELPYQAVRYRILQGTMDVNTKCEVEPGEEMTALQLAVKKQDWKLINYLLQNNVGVNAYTSKCEPALFLAIRSGNVGLVKTLIHHRARINITYDNNTPLHLAVDQNNYAITEFLIRRRAEVNALTKENQSPLQIAIEKNNLNLVKLLIKNNADINRVTKNYETALIFSIKNENFNLFKILLDAGAEVNPVNLPPLFVAVEKNCYKMTERLIERGANINTIYNNQTALIIAVEKENMKIVKLLIRNKADINVEIAAAQTALHLAVLQDNYEFTEFLISSGADVNSLDGRRQTPLHISVTKKNKKIINLLLKNNADVNVFDDDNLSPLKIAVINGNKEIVELLLDKAEITVKKSLESLLKIAWYSNDFETFELLFDVGLKIYPLAAGKIVPPLHMAVIKNNLEILDDLINDGADINGSFWGKTPLEIAVCRGYEKMTELLVKNKANVNLKNGVDILKVAVKKDNFELMRILVDAGSNVNYGSPLHEAIENNNYEIVKYLITNGANGSSVNSLIRRVRRITPLQRAVGKGNQKIVKLLIEYKADVNDRPFFPKSACLITAIENNNFEMLEILTHTNDAEINPLVGQPPLHAAVHKNNYKMTEYLINKGARVNTSYDDKIPLHIAVGCQNKEIVKLLIKNNADVDFITESGVTALGIAVEKESLELVKILLDTGANINPFSIFPPLQIAVGCQNNEIVQLLIENKADVDFTTKSGVTALSIAVENESLELVKTLLDAGANINPSSSVPPLHIAVRCQKIETVKLLIKNNANVNFITESGVSALGIAVEIESFELVTILLNSGADINSSSDKGYSPLQHAIMKGNYRIAEYLINRGANINALCRREKWATMRDNRYNSFTNCISDSQCSLLQFAIDYYKPAMVKLLMENKVDISLVEKNNPLFLFDAIKYLSHEILELILSTQVNVSCIDTRKLGCRETLLHAAVKLKYSKHEIVKLLLMSENFIDINSLTTDGKSALDYAVNSDDICIIGALLNAGVKIPRYYAKANMGYRNTGRQMITDHIVKLKAANLHFDYENSHDLSNENFNILYPECLKEVERMKKTKIVKTNLSYYDVIIKSKHKTALGLSNTNFHVRFDSEMLSLQFPLYGGMIIYRLDEAQRRRQLLEKSNKILSLVFYGNLPYDVISQLNYYLTSRDLKILSSR